MQLSRKFWIFIILALIIPISIIALYSVWLVRINTEITQWKYLETIQTQLEQRIGESEREYIQESKNIAEIEYIIDKLYVYNKYWDQLTPATRNFDLIPLADLLKQISLNPAIENLAVYRKTADSYIQILSFGDSQYIPEKIFEKMQNQDFNRPNYFRYADGIYMQIIRVVYDEGKPVGAVLLQKGYTANYFSGFAARFNINIALFSKGVFLHNSIPAINDQLRNVMIDEQQSRFKLEHDSVTYYGHTSGFTLGNNVNGTIFLYTGGEDIHSSRVSIIRNILIITLGCILIPVATFLFWGSRIVNNIRSLLKATTKVARGDLEYQMEIGREDEFGKLRHNFNDMIVALKKNRNILERRNAELLLKNSYIDAVFQSLLINIIVLDEKFIVQVFSQNAKSRLELPADSAGRYLFDLPAFIPQKQYFLTQLSAVKEKGDFLRLPAVIFETGNYEIDLYPIKNSGGSVNTIVMVLLNITEKIKMERALIYSEKRAAIGQLAAGIAHEINNPMSVILNHIQLIQSKQLSEEDENRFMNRISSEIKRVSGLIERLLEFSREDAAHQESILPLPVIIELLNLFAPVRSENMDSGSRCSVRENAFQVGRWEVEFEGKKIRVCLSKSAHEYPVRSSTDSLKQVLFNILKNALQSINHDFGMIQINIESTPAVTDIKIKDNGTGIEEEHLEGIFDPFYSLRKESGTGLGLSLCQTLVKQMGGDIIVTSTPKRGSEFSVRIPSEEE